MIEITGEMRHIIFNEVDVKELVEELLALFVTVDKTAPPGMYDSEFLGSDYPTTYKLFKTLRREK